MTTVTTTVKIISIGEVEVVLPTGPCGEGGIADITYKIKLQNGKKISGNELTYRIVNPKCVSCVGNSCTRKVRLGYTTQNVNILLLCSNFVYLCGMYV